MNLSNMPPDTPCYVVGIGEVTVAEIVAAQTEDSPKDLDDETEATYQMWEDIATRNLLRKPCQKRVSISAIKVYHASRYTRGQTRQGTA